MLRRKKGGSLLKFWLFSYLSILMIPLLLILVFGKQAFHILEKEISNAYLNSLKQVQYYIDSELSVVQDTALKLTVNEQVNILQGMQWDFRLSDHYTLYNIQKNLKMLCDTNFFISGIYLYQDYNEILISDRDIYQKENFDFANQENFQVSREDFHALLTQKYSGEFLFLDAQASGEETGHTQIIYALSLPLMPTDVVRINLLISIDWERLNNLFIEWNWTEGNYVSFLTDSGYELRSPHGDVFYHQVQNSMLAETAQRATVGGTDVILCSLSSSVACGTYFSVLPLQQYNEDIHSLVHYIALAILICIIVGGILSYFYSRHNYRPIRNLLEQLHWPKKPHGSEQRANELLILKDSIEQLLQRYQTHSRELDWSFQHLRDHIIAQLLEGTYADDSHLQKELEPLQIHFPCSRFFVLVIQIDASDSLAAEDGQLVRFIIQNVTHELLSQDFTAVDTELHGDLIFLLSCQLPEEQGKERLRAFMCQGQNFISEHFGILFSYAAGGLYEGFSQISRCYSEARQVLEYQELLEQPDAIFLNEIREVADGRPEVLGTTVKMLHCILAEDFEPAIALAGDLFHTMETSRLPYQAVRNKMLGIISLYLEALHSLHQQNPELFPVWPLPCAEALYSAHSPVQAQAAILQTLQELADRKRVTDVITQENLKQQMLDFVGQNLFDPNLTISMLAEHFHFSLSYASKVFKRYTSIGFLHYVHTQRIAAAKELLLSTGWNLSAIAQQVGYCSDIALIRLFKKYTGVTPGKYRELHRQEKN